MIALVWLINGVYCKILGQVPRHEQIVAQILGSSMAGTFTLWIGICETALGIWILTRRRMKETAVFQILLIGSMNTLEFIMVPELLLWGKLNALFAFLFILIIYINAFLVKRDVIVNPS